jgi:hypothetical protein
LYSSSCKKHVDLPGKQHYGTSESPVIRTLEQRICSKIST